MNALARQPHAVLDLPSRKLKAMKIERLLDLDSRPGPQRVLEIGVGSGGISHYFGTHPSGRFDVVGVDVVDSRLARDGYHFVAINDTTLPFPDASFDVVISNHVIEHVGDGAAQAHHLAEMRRVMRDDGVGYLAVPNRWMLVEPHYRLALLSWWPESMRSAWLRLFGKGEHYDCRPLSAAAATTLIAAAGFQLEQQVASALRVIRQLEYSQGGWRAFVIDTLCRYPTFIRHVIPTLIFRLRRARLASHG